MRASYGQVLAGEMEEVRGETHPTQNWAHCIHVTSLRHVQRGRPWRISGRGLRLAMNAGTAIVKSGKNESVVGIARGPTWCYRTLIRIREPNDPYTASIQLWGNRRKWTPLDRVTCRALSQKCSRGFLTSPAMALRPSLAPISPPSRTIAHRA